MIPLGFPPCSKWRIVAPRAALFSLRAIIAVTWHEWGIATASEVRIGGHQMRLVHHSQGWVSSSDYQRNGKADRYDIRGQLDSQMPSSIGPEVPCQVGLIRLADHIACRCKPRPYYQVKPGCDSTSHLAAIAALAARRSARGFEYASRGEDTTLEPSEEARQMADYLSRSIEAKGWE
jgi:hypothetical protein